jgi:hypothetical protein
MMIDDPLISACAQIDKDDLMKILERNSEENSEDLFSSILMIFLEYLTLKIKRRLSFKIQKKILML